jgi:UDP-N-acetylglucosamine 2-epimerase (hydrolysing)
MRFNYFSVLMKNCSGLIGNSSAGVREAPFLGIASLDIGTRQTNRTDNDSESITRCTAFDKKIISEFINSMWGIRYESCLEFGDGNAAKRFIDIIRKKSFWKHSKQKNFYE